MFIEIMKIIVVGNGKIGELLVQQLSREGHEVVVVDSNPARLEFMQEKLDVAVVPGNGASIEILREAGADSADLLIAVTNSDEVNLLTALVAEKLGCNYTVARVRSPEYDREMNLLKTSFGINV
ncbi:MAG: NAD-binding protein, partial [Stomatobaculum longum]